MGYRVDDSSGQQVGLREVVVHKEKRLPGQLRDGVGETIAEVQPRRVSAPTQSPVRVHGDPPVFLGAS